MPSARRGSTCSRGGCRGGIAAGRYGHAQGAGPVAARGPGHARQGRCPRPARTRSHTFAAAASGAAGGAFGMAGLAVAPVTTTLILRSIADVARSEGEALDGSAGDVRLLRGADHGRAAAVPTHGSESGYFAARALLAQQVAAAAQASRCTAWPARAGRRSATAGAIASRFSVNVRQKLALLVVPVVGASPAPRSTRCSCATPRMARGISWCAAGSAAMVRTRSARLRVTRR